MFGLFTHEIPQARSNEGEGSGGKRKKNGGLSLTELELQEIQNGSAEAVPVPPVPEKPKKAETEPETVTIPPENPYAIDPSPAAKKVEAASSQENLKAIRDGLVNDGSYLMKDINRIMRVLAQLSQSGKSAEQIKTDTQRILSNFKNDPSRKQESSRGDSSTATKVIAPKSPKKSRSASVKELRAQDRAAEAFENSQLGDADYAEMEQDAHDAGFDKHTKKTEIKKGPNKGKTRTQIVWDQNREKNPAATQLDPTDLAKHEQAVDAAEESGEIDYEKKSAALRRAEADHGVVNKGDIKIDVQGDFNGFAGHGNAIGDNFEVAHASSERSASAAQQPDKVPNQEDVQALINEQVAAIPKDETDPVIETSESKAVETEAENVPTQTVQSASTGGEDAVVHEAVAEKENNTPTETSAELEVGEGVDSQIKAVRENITRITALTNERRKKFDLSHKEAKQGAETSGDDAEITYGDSRYADVRRQLLSMQRRLNAAEKGVSDISQEEIDQMNTQLAEMLWDKPEDTHAEALERQKQINATEIEVSDVVKNNHEEAESDPDDLFAWGEKNEAKKAEEETYSAGEYVVPDESLLDAQQEWKQVLPKKNADEQALASIQQIVEGRKLAPEKIFGMHIPRAGGLDVDGNPQEDIKARIAAVSFREGFYTALSRVDQSGWGQDKKDALNSVRSVLQHVPDSGLTKEQVAELKHASEVLNSSENPLNLSSGRVIEDMYKELDQKLESKGVKKKVEEVRRDKKGRKETFMVLGGAALTGLVAAFATPTADGTSEGDGVSKAPDVISENPEQPTEPEIVTENGATILQTPDGKGFVIDNTDFETTSPSIPDAPELDETIVTSENPEPHPATYTFEGKKNDKGVVIDTVSEAAFEVWKDDKKLLPKSATESQFLAAMWAVIADMEKSPIDHAELTKAMDITSGDIHTVFTGKENAVKLQPFFERINEKI